MKLSDLSVEHKSDFLKDKKICLCVCGGIASVEVVKLIRELRRQGAHVFVQMTPQATKFITPLSLEWASTHEVLTEITSGVPHTFEADLYMVAPATAHSINKFALGLCDNLVLTTLATAWGRGSKIVIIPTMYEDLYENPALQKNLKNLREEKNIFILSEEPQENKIKFPDIDKIVAYVCHLLNKNEKNVLITGGPTRAYLDKVRYLENISSGELGVTMADTFYKQGFNVTLVYGPGKFSPPQYVRTIHVTTAQQMKRILLEVSKTQYFDAALFSAAVLDFEPQETLNQKKSSQADWVIHLKPTEKLMDHIPCAFKVGFKLEYDISEVDLLQKASMWSKEKKVNVVVANDLKLIKGEKHPAWILYGDHIYKASSKQEISQILSSIILSL
ncbi:MAG: bifunctional phosphopantothenoylcysteine decarboxylase/phosphopantothenate--cysteine ligase CoaBC [Deltaproteobacteria bacterium]|nr:bifunctional phosphopantothenoylcysteine decarboxylase/phosphopantothenate--cysteine ligase CoaBC [Deltaproteobacteria bacterium]